MEAVRGVVGESRTLFLAFRAKADGLGFRKAEKQSPAVSFFAK